MRLGPARGAFLALRTFSPRASSAPPSERFIFTRAVQKVQEARLKLACLFSRTCVYMCPAAPTLKSPGSRHAAYQTIKCGSLCETSSERELDAERADPNAVSRSRGLRRRAGGGGGVSCPSSANPRKLAEDLPGNVFPPETCIDTA